MPYYNTLLLSSWTKSSVPNRPRYVLPPEVIPPQILNTMKLNENIAYAAVPKELRGRRNMVTDAKKDRGARFRSGKRADVSVFPLVSVRVQ
jgi:PAB-dependent poly(A)-specific ribonuclease subunit 2